MITIHKPQRFDMDSADSTDACMSVEYDGQYVDYEDYALALAKINELQDDHINTLKKDAAIIRGLKLKIDTLEDDLYWARA